MNCLRKPNGSMTDVKSEEGGPPGLRLNLTPRFCVPSLESATAKATECCVPNSGSNQLPIKASTMPMFEGGRAASASYLRPSESRKDRVFSQAPWSNRSS